MSGNKVKPPFLPLPRPRTRALEPLTLFSRKTIPLRLPYGQYSAEKVAYRGSGGSQWP